MLYHFFSETGSTRGLTKRNEPRREKTFFAYAKTKTQISFAVTAKLISAFVFATLIEQSLYFLNPKFQVSSHFPQLYSLVCVGPGRNPRRPVFSQRGSNKEDKCSSHVSYIKVKTITTVALTWSHHNFSTPMQYTAILKLSK